MSNVHSLEQALADSAVLADAAELAGITSEQAKRVVAALANVPIKQAIRICVAAEADRVRQINRQTRRSR
jgi:hypothetical protein